MFRRLISTTCAPRSPLLARTNFYIARIPSVRFYSEGKPSTNSFIDRADAESRIIALVKKHDKVNGAQVAPNASFVKDLGLDSLDAAEIVMAVEDEFSIQIPDEEAFKFLSIPEVVDYIVTHPMAK